MSQSERHGERPRRPRPPDAEMGAFEAAEGALLESGVSPESCCARGIDSNSSLLRVKLQTVVLPTCRARHPRRRGVASRYVTLIYFRLTRRAHLQPGAAVPGQTIAVY